MIERLGSGDSDKAWARAVQLARGGAVEIECTTEGARLGAPVCWRLTERFARRRTQQTTRRRNERESWEQRALAAADAHASRWPELAHALRRHVGPVERRVLVYAAEDLLAGRRELAALAAGPHTSFGLWRYRTPILAACGSPSRFSPSRRRLQSSIRASISTTRARRGRPTPSACWGWAQRPGGRRPVWREPAWSVDTPVEQELAVVEAVGRSLARS